MPPPTLNSEEPDKHYPVGRLPSGRAKAHAHTHDSAPTSYFDEAGAES